MDLENKNSIAKIATQKGSSALHLEKMYGGSVVCRSPSSLNRSDNMTVMKFGGTSTGSIERMCGVVKIIVSNLHKKPCIVLSALGDTTNQLLKLGRQAEKGFDFDTTLLKAFHLKYVDALETTKKDFSIELTRKSFVAKECPVFLQQKKGEETEEEKTKFDRVIKTTTNTINDLFEELESALKIISSAKEMGVRETDLLMSFGERLAVRIASLFLQSAGINATPYDAWNLGLLTNTATNADLVEVLPVTYDNLHKNLKELNRNFTHVPIITGFLGADAHGKVTTLGRSGGDFSAAIVGAAIHAREIQIWTDVDGVLTADPRIVPDASTIPVLSFEEATEFAYFGAKVIHPRTMHPAMTMGIPIRVKNTMEPTCEGTVVTNVRTQGFPNWQPVIGLTCKEPVTVVDIVSTKMLGAAGFLAKLFSIFDKLQICVDVIATSEVSVSLTVDRNTSQISLNNLENQLGDCATVTMHKNKGMISIICDTLHATEILSKAASTLIQLGIPVEMVSYGASKVNISLIVDQTRTIEALRALHETFIKIPKEGRVTESITVN